MPASTDKSCPSCKAMAEALASLVSRLPAVPADMIERMASNEVSAFQRGIEYGRQLERAVGPQEQDEQYWLRRAPVIPQVADDPDETGDDSVLIAQNGLVGTRNGA